MASPLMSIAVDNDRTEERPSDGVERLAREQNVRMVEAVLFAADEAVSADDLAARLPDDADIGVILDDLAKHYASRGVNVVEVAGKWMFRTAADLSFLLAREQVAQRKLSRAALETLAIIAYHQPVTRADIEEIRGVATSKGTLDVLMEAGWVRMRGRRRTPGRPVTYGITDDFLVHFGLNGTSDLPGMEELKGAGLLDSRVPMDPSLPDPHASVPGADEEDPLDGDEVVEETLEDTREVAEEEDRVAEA